MLGKGRSHWFSAGEAGDDRPILNGLGLGSEFVFCRARLQLLKLQLKLVEQLAAAGSADGPKRSRRNLAMTSLRCATIASAPVARASASWRAWRSATSAAVSALIPSGRTSAVSLGRGSIP